MTKRQWIGWSVSILFSAFAAITAVTQFPKIWSPEHHLSDWMVTLLAPVKPIDPDIVLITIRNDPKHRQELSSLLPTDRRHLSLLTKCMSDSGARVIGFDMLFDWPDTPSTDDLESQMLISSKTSPIIIATARPPEISSKFDINTIEIERFSNNANVKTGNVELIHSKPHGPVRHAFGDNGVAPQTTFAGQIARASGLEIENPEFVTVNEFRISWSHAAEKVGGKSIHFADYSSVDIVDLCEKGNDEILSQRFKGRIILVGSRAQPDLHNIPFSVRSDYVWGITGLEIHAHIISQILRGPNIIEPNNFWKFVLAFFASILGFLISKLRMHKAWRPIVLIATFVVITVLVWGLYATVHVLLPLSLIFIAVANGTVIEQTRENANLLGKWILKIFVKTKKGSS